MIFLKRVFDFYINSSVHVALAVACLVLVTFEKYVIPNDYNLVFFSFFGTLAAYNFVKYTEIIRIQKKDIRNRLKMVSVLSLISLGFAVFFFFRLKEKSQWIVLISSVFTVLYTLPVFPKMNNFRNWAGIKIYIVTLCWVAITVFLPILNSEIPIGNHVFIFALQRFILVFVLILIFEIVDLAKDSPNLKTIPQQIGVQKTKVLGYVLLFLFCVLEVLSSNYRILVWMLAFATALFLAFANEKRSRYYTSFWVESIPIVWWLMLLVLQKC